MRRVGGFGSRIRSSPCCSHSGGLGHRAGAPFITVYNERGRGGRTVVDFILTDVDDARVDYDAVLTGYLEAKEGLLIVMDRAVLLDAARQPHLHPDLSVRVNGRVVRIAPRQISRMKPEQ